MSSALFSELLKEVQAQMAYVSAQARVNVDSDGDAGGADDTSYWGIRACNRGMDLAVLACHSTKRSDVVPFYNWKRDPVPAQTDAMASELAALVTAWFPVRGADWIVTTPPQGASRYKTVNGVYPAGCLGRAVATNLRLDFVTTLARQDEKRWHGLHQSLAQSEFVVVVRAPSVAIVIDDMLTSGNTMSLACRALRAAGIPTVSYVWTGN